MFGFGQHLSSIPPWYLSFDTTLDSSITLKRGTLFSTLEFFSETKTLTVSSSQVTCYFLQQLVCESVFGMSVTYQTNHYVIFKTLTQFTITTYFLFHVEVQFSASQFHSLKNCCLLVSSGTLNYQHCNQIFPSKKVSGMYCIIG